MDIEQMKYVMELPRIMMDDSVTEYNGYNPQTGRQEPIIMKKDHEIWIHAAVYGLLEENELMDDMIDYFVEHKTFSKVIVFDDQNQSVIRLDY